MEIESHVVVKLPRLTSPVTIRILQLRQRVEISWRRRSGVEIGERTDEKVDRSHRKTYLRLR